MASASDSGAWTASPEAPPSTDQPKAAPTPETADFEAEGSVTGERAAARNRREDPPA